MGKWAERQARLDWDPWWIKRALETGVDCGNLDPHFLSGILRRFDRDGGPDGEEEE
jgi:hypothetical protein